MIVAEIEPFKDFLEIEERSPHTIRHYLDILDWLEAFLRESSITLENLIEKDVIRFQLWLKKKHSKKQFVKRYQREPSA